MIFGMMIQIKRLQQQLQEEINLRLALTSAVEHSSSPFMDSPCELPDKVLNPLSPTYKNLICCFCY